MLFSFEGFGVLIGESVLAWVGRELLEPLWEVSWLLMGSSAVRWWCPFGPGGAARTHIRRARRYWGISLTYLLGWSALYWD